MKQLLAVLFLLLPWLAAGEEVLPSVQVYDKNGVLLRGLLSSKNTYYLPVSLDQISPFLIGAVVAVEDQRFFEHSGVDTAAVLRAAYQNSTEGKIVSGASTITQQLVRTLKPRPKNWWGKLTEAASAIRTETQLSKEEILETYLNSVQLGNLTQGVQAASLFYFGLDAKDISLSQAALLAGLLKSPTYYNPLTHFTRALKRRDYVLKRMHEETLISDEMYTAALAEKITLKKQKNPFQAPHFVQLLKPFLPPNTSYVWTTLDSEVQEIAQRALKAQVNALEQENVTNGAVVVIDNASGGILAYVGSADFNDKLHSGQVDAARALRQPGSALKPFVYALALQNGRMTPATLLDDTDTFFEGGFRPRNYDETYHGRVMLRQALACSYNIPAVKAAEVVGTPAILAFLQQAGILTLTKPADFYGLGISLGNGEVKLLELANAYATLARGGLFKPLVLAQKPFISLPGNFARVLDEQTAYLITHILKDNQARSPAFGLNSPLYAPFEMAAKTGTSKDYKDNFALGYTPRWTVGVWVGNLDASPMEKVSGITGAGPVLHEVALFLNEKYPSAPFEEPSGIVHKPVCTHSGLLAGKNCLHTREEVFNKKFLPAVCDGSHTSIAGPLKILSPQNGDIYKLDPSAPRATQAVLLQAQCKESCQWFVDEKAFKSGCRVWWPLAGGKHTLEVLCGKERAQVRVEVLD